MHAATSLHPLVAPLHENQGCHICVSFLFRNRRCPFPSSSQNRNIEELHSSSTLSLPRHCLLPPPPNKRCREPHNSSSHPFLVFSLGFSYVRTHSHRRSSCCRHHSSLHLSLHRLDIWPVRSPESPSCSPSIHGELSCITAITRSNSNDFLSSQAHY
jgi:hypothetical protein